MGLKQTQQGKMSLKYSHSHLCLKLGIIVLKPRPRISPRRQVIHELMWLCVSFPFWWWQIKLLSPGGFSHYLSGSICNELNVNAADMILLSKESSVWEYQCFKSLFQQNCMFYWWWPWEKFSLEINKEVFSTNTLTESLDTSTATNTQELNNSIIVWT